MNELDAVKDWYVISRDVNYEMSRLIEENEIVPSNKSFFYAMPAAELLDNFRTVREKMDDFAILSMVAVFEQELLNTVEIIYNSIRKDSKNSNLKQSILNFFHNKTLKRPHFKDILDLFKETVGEELLNQVKQIYEYRNWIAHGKYSKKPSPEITDPLTTYDKLADFLETIKNTVTLNI